jgi:hypothetical protein
VIDLTDVKCCWYRWYKHFYLVIVDGGIFRLRKTFLTRNLYWYIVPGVKQAET